MKCLQPLYALDTGAINPDTGNRHIHILPKRADLYDMQSLEARYGKGNILQLPCGKCINCRINYARTWALRCVCEASYYDDNFFVTLTYDNDHYPGHLVKKDLQDFFKRVRKYKSFRYFACGEYGDQFDRGHYHIIMFGLQLDDLKPIGKGPHGGYYYSSMFLQKMWPFGFVTIGDVSYSSCNYVAQYVVKKINKKDNHEFPAFITMSLKPGIGQRYFEDHWQKIYDTDSLYINAGDNYVNNVPRYFDKLLQRIAPQILDDVKFERIDKSSVSTLAQLTQFNMQFQEQLLQEVNVQVAINKMKDINRRKMR